MRSEHLIQMFLLGTEILAFACFAKSEQIAIKLQAGVCVGNPDRGVINAEKKLVGLLLPARVALAWRKINDLKIVLIGITKVERFDSGSSFNRGWQRLWTGRDELHLQRSQFFKGLVHVAYDNCRVLKPKVVAARIGGNRPTRRGEILR